MPPRHFKPLEATLWSRFQSGAHIPDSELKFDTELGNGMTPPPDTPEWILRMIKSLTVKRADVIWHAPSADFIIELADRIEPSTVGKLLTYRHLYQAQFPSSKPTLLMAVSTRIAPDMDTVISALGMVAVLLPE